MNNKTGFTLVEILISMMIMSIAFASTFQLINYLIQKNEANEVAVLCTNVAQGLMDEIRNVNFDDIVGNYNNMQFSLNELTNRNITHLGLVRVSELEVGFLLRVKIIICWRQRDRMMGEDVNFDGVLNTDEDINGNGELDSPCSIEAAIVYQ